MGRCPACGEWNTMVEKTLETGVTKARNTSAGSVRAPQQLSDISSSAEQRISLGYAEVDRVLGGGIVPGSLVLIGGEPGIGKSTLSLQIPLACPDLETLYVTGEESARQVKMRADRLGGNAPHCHIFSETCIDDVLDQAAQMKPALMVVDSVQTMYTSAADSTPGSVSQVKEVASALLRFAKESGIAVILIGHITKDGYIAGPKVLEHIVDVVLQF
jgi:DNA repair protein RadA/Sms